MARNIHWTSLYFPSNERYISELEILNDKLEVQLKADLKKEIYTQNKIKEKEILIVEYLSKLRQLKEEVLTPESDIYVTPEWSPTDVRYSFGHSRSVSDSGLSSLHCTNTLYYSLVTVDEVYSCESADILEKELAEQDQLFKSFKSIISRDSKNTKSDNKPFTLGPPAQKPQYYLKYSASGKHYKKNKELNIKLCVNSNIKDKFIFKTSENNCKSLKNVGSVNEPEKVLSYKTLQEGLKATYRTDSTRFHVNCGSSANCENLNMNKTKMENEEIVESESVGPDSCLEAASSGYLTGTSPKDNNASASESTAFGGDLTEMATSEEIPHDNDQSARSSSMSSDAGTWDCTFVPTAEAVIKEQSSYDSKTTVLELSDHDSNYSTIKNENVSLESFRTLYQDCDQLHQPLATKNSLSENVEIKYRGASTGNSAPSYADIHLQFNTDASLSHPSTNSNGEIQLDSKESGMFTGKNNFFINAASLLDENEMTSIHPNSLNYNNDNLEVHCFSTLSKPRDEIEQLRKREIHAQPLLGDNDKKQLWDQSVVENTTENMCTKSDIKTTEEGDLEKRRSSLIRRNTFELELDDERLAALRRECERHQVQQNSCSSFDGSNITHSSIEATIRQPSDKEQVPNSLPGLLCTSGVSQKYDQDMHSPDSLNNDGPLDNPLEKQCHSLPFQVNVGVIETMGKREVPGSTFNSFTCEKNTSDYKEYFVDSLQETDYQSKMVIGFTGKNSVYKNTSEKSNIIESVPILSGGISMKDVASPDITYSSPILNRRKTEFAPIISGGSVIDLEPETESKYKQNSSFSSSWIVDMSETNKSPPEDNTNQTTNSLSRISSPEVKMYDSQKPPKSNNSSLGFFVSLDDPLDEKSSGDSGYKSSSLLSNKDIESSKSVSRGDAMSSATNLSSCSSSCGFYVDLKETQVVAEKPVEKETSSQDKKLFSMFIDIGETGNNSENKCKIISPHIFKRRNNKSHSGLHTLKREERSRFSDSQMSSESSLELTDSPDISRDKQSIEKEVNNIDTSTVQVTSSVNHSNKVEEKGKKQGFYMFIESDQSPVPQRRILPTGMVPASQRHSWNSECHNFNLPGNVSACDIPKRSHRRSHSVSVNKSLDIMFNVEQNENKSSSVSPLVKVSASNSTGYESGPSSIDDTAIKSCSKSMMSSWHGSVRPSVELQKVIAKNEGKERKEIRLATKTVKSPLEAKADIVDEIFESVDKSDEFICLNSKGEDLSNASNESCNTATGKHSNSTFIISDVSNVANATSNDLEITTPTCDIISQLSKDDSDKTETDFDDVGDKKSCDIPRTPDHSISQMEIPVTERTFNFVKLSDMDKEPKKMPLEEKSCINRMSRSIPEASWIESKMMTRSATSRSLSRLFPHLNTSARNITPDSGDHDTDFSEISSMQSSMDPSALEGSTEDTDASSCANGPVSRLGEDLLRMFLDEISPDVTVEVGGRRIKAHKCILSSRCQYFAAILSGGWVESAGNVISLQGFSYSAVHFALCHIYSGASNIPDSINIVELATLADMLCLEGLKEVIMYTLKVKYCHFFHKPCPMCTVGVLECLPLAAAYGLDEIYRKSLRWITKYFVRVWPTKGFASLPRELLDKCYKQHIVHMTVDNVLETVMCCSKLQGLIPNMRWAEPVFALASKLHEAAVKFIAQHFCDILSSDVFMSLGKEQLWTMSQLEEALLSAADKLPPDQACKCHSHLYKLSSVINTPQSALVVNWNDGFVEFLNLLSSTVENCLLKQAARASRTPAWTLMEPQLRHKIQDAACLVIVPGDDRRRARHLLKRGEATNVGKRSVDLLQTKSPVTDVSTTKKTTASTRPANTASVKPKTPQAANKTEQSGPRPKTWPYKISEVKSRYLEPKATPKQSPAPTNAIKQEKTNLTPTARRNVSKSIISSSDSSRTSSPAMKRSVPQRTSRSLPSKESKRNDNLTMSTDSLADPSTSGTKKKAEVSKNQPLPRIDFVEKNVRSLTVKPGVKVAPTEVSTRVTLNDSKGKTAAISKIENEKPKFSPVSVSKRSSCQSSPRVKDSPVPQVKSTVNSTPSPSNRQNVLSPKEKSHVTADTKSTLLKRNTTYRVQSAKLSSPMKVSTVKSKELIGTSPSSKANINKIQSKVVNSSKKSASNNNILTNNRKTESKSQPMVGSRSGTFLKDEPTVLKKPQVLDCSE